MKLTDIHSSADLKKLSVEQLICQKNERVVIPGALFCIPLQKMVFMDLNGILASIVAESGIEVLESDDLHLNNSVSEALYGYPAIASVLSKAVTSGSLRRMVASGIWDDATERLIDKFVAHTGFRPDLAQYVFRSAAKAAGIDPGTEPEAATLKPGASDENAGKEAAQSCHYDNNEVENPAWNRIATMAEKARFITSIIETDTEMEEPLGVTVKYPFCTKAEEGVIYLSLEISRTRPLATGAMHIALYDMRGAIVTAGLAAALTLSSPSRMPVTLRLTCDTSSLSRILLYWH